MKAPLSFPAKYVLWFIGTCMNGVKHPRYGSNQITEHQLKYSTAKYKDALYKEIATQYVDSLELQQKLKEIRKIPVTKTEG